MPSRSLARPAALGAAAALVLLAAVSAADQPAVPPVSEIPVAPAPRPHKSAAAPAPAQTPSTTTTTVTTTTVTTPSLAAVAPEPAPAAQGVPEAMPAAPVTTVTVSPRIVLVDDEPSRTSHTRARELPENEHGKGHHPKHGRHGRPFHPAPGIVVDVLSAQGGASAADLQRTARNLGYWAFRHCYEEGLQRNQQLAGSVHFTLTKQGAGGATQLADSSIKDESVTLCVLREARHLELTWGASASDASDGATADVKVSLATGDEPVPTPRPIAHADEVREALHASLPAVQQCYASGLARHPDEGGRMELRFHAKSSGEITEVSEDEPRYADVDVTRCVLGVMRGAKLPHLHGSHTSSFDYALHFEAAPGAASK
jgi:hypothetical protein